jgi:hypothetical protein
MQAKKKRHRYHLSLAPSPTAAGDEAREVLFEPADPDSVAVAGSLLLTPAEHGCTALCACARLATSAAGGGAAGGAGGGPGAPSTLRLSAPDATLLLDDLLSVVPALFRVFERRAAVDERALSALAGYFEGGPGKAPGASAEEEALVERSLALEERGWARVKGTVRQRAGFFRAAAADGAWGRAVADVDAEAGLAAAWLWHGNSYERLADYVGADGDAISEAVAVPGTQSKLAV